MTVGILKTGKKYGNHMKMGLVRTIGLKRTSIGLRSFQLKSHSIKTYSRLSMKKTGGMEAVEDAYD